MRTVFSLALILGLLSPALGRDNKLPEAVTAALDKAESIELYSLDPNNPTEKPKDGGFHGWKVLGKTTVTKDAKERSLKALYKGIADNDGKVAACFIPRHGVRVTHDGKTFDLVICFECLQIQVFEGDKRSGVLVTRGPQPTLDKILTDAKVPLPKQREP
jgi:hypothetical protein